MNCFWLENVEVFRGGKQHYTRCLQWTGWVMLGPLHLDLLEPNKWRVYLCLQNCVPCMSVICRLAECCCWCSLYHYTEKVNFTILETLSTSGALQDSEMNDLGFCLFVFLCWELLLSVVLLWHRHCLPTVLLKALSFRTGFKVKFVYDFN